MYVNKAEQTTDALAGPGVIEVCSDLISVPNALHV